MAGHGASTLLLTGLSLSNASSASLFKYKLSATSRMQIINIILNCTDKGSNATHFDFADLLPFHHFTDEDTLKQCDETGQFSQCFASKFASNSLIEPEVVDRVTQLLHALDYFQEMFCFSNQSRAEFRESVQCFRHPLVILKYIELKAKYKVLRHVLFGDEGFNREIECCLEYARIGETKKAINGICENDKFGNLAEILMQELSFGSLLGIYKVCSSNFGMGKTYLQCKSVLPLHIANRLPSSGEKQINETTTKKPILPNATEIYLSI
ncbi:hypothetical protein TYRP_012097 [Tyrophagus putrescentiae]|nr:hypothetical protein TYRP_012097 [Tyrophagus putrescentiae]